MKAFIAISKMIRNKYKSELPFISAMCKGPQREDVQLYLTKYLKFKKKGDV